jgi:hypothetical protein
MKSLPFRQVHLDFHTSPHIPDIGVDFDPEEFVATLKAAHVNSITVFAKCHHGYSYYPTEVGVTHPNLKRDLMGEMLVALKRAGIRAPVYTTVTWDELAWATHPEWRQISPDGRIAGPSTTPLKPGWKNLCMNSGYGDYVIEQIEEILNRYRPEALFIDIVRYIGGPCVCSTCLPQIVGGGYDPEDHEHLLRFALAAERRFMGRCTRAIRAIAPDTGIFYNSRLKVEANPAIGNRVELDNFTHIEIESLPGGFWGYDHFPLFVRHFATYGRELLAMTGRFHTTWGDFGGLRNRAALEFECFLALAHGARISVGDQLHPRGKLDPAVYKRIGEVFAAVEEREPYSAGSVALDEIGVLSSKGGISSRPSDGNDFGASDTGALHALEQLHHQFAVLDRSCDLSPYAVVVLPDNVIVDAGLAEKLRKYVAGGGRLLVSDRSGLDAGAGNFLIADLLGVHYAGAAPFAPDYMALGEEISAGIEEFAHVCQLQGSRVSADAGTQVLAHAREPYFNRTWEHFCSHQYTPQSERAADPLVTQKGGVIYIARPLFREYAESARRVHRQLIGNCLSRLLPRPRVGANNLPTTATVTVRRLQSDLIVHILHYVHQRRGNGLDIVEDVLPLHDVTISIRAEQPPTEVRFVPEGAAADWEWDEGYVRISIPRVDGYRIVQLVGAAG